MNYLRLYNSIIERARSEADIRKCDKRGGGYYECHHILPKSLGGTDLPTNKALLTAREHFICHWVLVKIYKPNTIERQKMMCALWMLRGKSQLHKGRYINSRAYEALRIEFATYIGKQNALFNKGCNNPAYGKKWFTNYETGETRRFSDTPLAPWVLGRNLFRGETMNIHVSEHFKERQNHRDRNDPTDGRRMTVYHRTCRLTEAKTIWDMFHSGQYLSIRDFCRKENKPLKRTMVLLRLIPAFGRTFVGRSHNNGSNHDMVNVYT